MFVRYAMLAVVSAVAVWGAVNLGTNNTNAYLVDAGQAGPSANVSLWVLGGVASVLTLSLCRFVISGLPLMMGGWCRDNKSWVFTAGAGAAIYSASYLM